MFVVLSNQSKASVPSVSHLRVRVLLLSSSVCPELDIALLSSSGHTCRFYATGSGLYYIAVREA